MPFLPPAVRPRRRGAGTGLAELGVVLLFTGVQYERPADRPAAAPGQPTGPRLDA